MRPIWALEHSSTLTSHCTEQTLSHCRCLWTLKERPWTMGCHLDLGKPFHSCLHCTAATLPCWSIRIIRALFWYTKLLLRPFAFSRSIGLIWGFSLKLKKNQLIVFSRSIRLLVWDKMLSANCPSELSNSQVGQFWTRNVWFKTHFECHSSFNTIPFHYHS